LSWCWRVCPLGCSAPSLHRRRLVSLSRCIRMALSLPAPHRCLRISLHHRLLPRHLHLLHQRLPLRRITISPSLRPLRCLRSPQPTTARCSSLPQRPPLRCRSRPLRLPGRRPHHRQRHCPHAKPSRAPSTPNLVRATAGCGRCPRTGTRLKADPDRHRRRAGGIDSAPRTRRHRPPGRRKRPWCRIHD
jgi:hypothetical protein